jgi:N-methylhydantoinase A/oxoprolinase/acetone carboxylase beta subunit
MSVAAVEDPRGGLIGVEVGRTHTDVQVVLGEQLARGKALTSSVFCARGLLTGDFVLRYDQSVNWYLTDGSGAARVNSLADQLVRRAIDDMRAEGFEETETSVARSGDFQFPGQVFQLSMRVPEKLAEEDIGALSHRFFELYERM